MAKRKALPVPKNTLSKALLTFGVSLRGPRLKRLDELSGGRVFLKDDHVDLLQLIGAARSKIAVDGERYLSRKNRVAERDRAMSVAGREIGEIPPVSNPERRAAAEDSFRVFCETYGKGTFSLAWSDDHLRVIEKIERSVRHGELLAIAMPRGSGKTSLCEWGGLWAILFGFRKFVVLIGAGGENAEHMLESITSELTFNELLLADFPESCYPIAALDGITNRARGQLYKGRPTRIEWTKESIRMPYIPDSPSRGALIRVAGLQGSIRGMKEKDLEGNVFRPDLVLVDDPQTDGSARSPSQSATRERILAGAVLGLAGPGKKIAGLMAVTVIAPGDMADNLLNRQLHPEWQGERTKLIYALPTNRELWDEYARIRQECLESGCGLAPATDFYRKHQAEMDDGAFPAWRERFNPDEASAIQHAMNLKLADPISFAAEYQNDPIPEVDDAVEMMTAEQIAQKFSNVKEKVVPLEHSRLTAFIDVQQTGLYYCVNSWSEDFSGSCIAYGTEPEQTVRYFTARDMGRTIQHQYPDGGLESQLYRAIEALCERLLDRAWVREDGMELKIERALIDANWGKSTDIVYQFCRTRHWGSVLMPSHGKAVTASGAPMQEWKRKPGERTGLNWRIPSQAGKRFVRHALYDTNFWKSFLHGRLRTMYGDPGCLTLFGANAMRHRMISDHLTAEYAVRVEARGRVVDEWKIKPSRPENHWLDCQVGNCVAASMLGISLPELEGQEARFRRRGNAVKLSEIQRRKRMVQA